MSDQSSWHKVEPEHTARGRDLRLDLLRGQAVVTMVIDHLGGPSPLYLLTGGNAFVTSAAETFVFISGFVAAVAYGRVATTRGLRVASTRILRRAGLLYLLTLALTVIMLPASQLVGMAPCSGCPAVRLDLSDPVAVLLRLATLRETYYLVDIPLLYTRLLLLTPLALALLVKRRTWLLLLVSWAIWLGQWAAPDYIRLDWVENNSTFHILAWQVLFFTGMAIGHHRVRLAHLFHLFRFHLITLGAIVVIGFVEVVLVWAGHGPHVRGMLACGGLPLPVSWWDAAFSKAALGPGRLFASLAVITGSFLVVDRLWHPIERLTGWLLLPLGQHSLFAYTGHVFLAVGLTLGQALAGQLVPQGQPAAAIQILSVSAIWVCCRSLSPTGKLLFSPARRRLAQRNVLSTSAKRQPIWLSRIF